MFFEGRVKTAGAIQYRHDTQHNFHCLIHHLLKNSI